MTTFETQYSLFRPIKIKKMDIQWLVTSGAPGERIANFGCSNGFETLALVCALGANEAIGIDNDGAMIRQARDYLEMIKIKKKELNETSVAFIEADIAKPIAELGSDYFTLAYCQRVLYNIWEDQGEDEIKSAINQMARVVRVGGWVVAVEFAVSRDGRPYDFRRFFKQAKLTQVTNIDSAVLEQAGLLIPVADNRKWYSSPGLYPYIYCQQSERGEHNGRN